MPASVAPGARRQTAEDRAEVIHHTVSRGSVSPGDPTIVLPPWENSTLHDNALLRRRRRRGFIKSICGNLCASWWLPSAPNDSQRSSRRAAPNGRRSRRGYPHYRSPRWCLTRWSNNRAAALGKPHIARQRTFAASLAQRFHEDNLRTSVRVMFASQCSKWQPA